MSYELVPKPTFLDQVATVNPAEFRKLWIKAAGLAQAPEPDSKNKKRLHCGKDLYRLRVGDYRVVYTFGRDDAGHGYVSLLGVDTRDDVYDDCPEAVGPGVDLGRLVDGVGAGTGTGEGSGHAQWQPARRPAMRDAADDLAVKFTDEVLERLGVPDEHRAAVAACKTIDDLILADIPETLRERIFNVVAEPDWERVKRQPDLVLEDGNDLIRFAEGDLITFLLKLDPEQEALVRRAVDGAGPMLVKGGPGTGKSTVAIYRVRELIAALRRAGVERPRILFTTYTNALTAASRQQLERLLGEDAALVDVQTADKLATDLVRQAGDTAKVLSGNEVLPGLEQAIAAAAFEGAPLKVQAQRRAIERLGLPYLAQELQAVIEARGIETLEDYLAASRTGRGVPLNATQREAVWRVHEAHQAILAKRKQMTFSGLRARAARIAAGQPGMYDAVLVDEAQDLDPVLLRMLVECCRTPDRIFVTADANQSIYGSGFRWTDVHAGLNFRGRTGLLKTNHRSTPQIDRAARSYLDAGAAAIDETEDASASGTRPHASGAPLTYSRTDGPPPIVREVADGHALASLLTRFVREVTRGWRMGVGSCAVLVPDESRGQQIAAWLSDEGVPAAFMAGRHLDLSQPSVKVITVKSAKGLEFPFVALAGFQPGFFPGIPTSAGEEGELEEALLRERRSLYVGMTRAMLALLVALPPNSRPPVKTLYRGFAPDLWDWERRTEPAGGPA